jgi:hypothetical protein
MRCAASDELTTSTALMLLPYSWAMRVNTRSAPVRSTRMAMPGYFASNDFATFSASGRSTDVYQMTLPSFFAASISAGVTAEGGGGAARTGAAKTVAASAVEPLRTSRRENLFRIVSSECLPLLVVVHGECSSYPASTRHRSGGKCAKIRLPCGMSSDGAVTTRICVPSAASTT